MRCPQQKWKTVNVIHNKKYLTIYESKGDENICDETIHYNPVTSFIQLSEQST